MTGSDHIRAFIAIPLPASVKSDLKALQVHLKKEKIRAAFPDPQNLHLTLKFIGDMEVNQIERVISCMHACADGLQEPLILKAVALGVFPSVKKGRVLWSGIGGRTDGLAALVRSLDMLLHQELAFRSETRRFSPHLTLARLKSKMPPEQLVRLIRRHADFCSQEFHATTIELIKSDLHASGAVHTRLAQIELPF